MNFFVGVASILVVAVSERMKVAPLHLTEFEPPLTPNVPPQLPYEVAPPLLSYVRHRCLFKLSAISESPIDVTLQMSAHCI